MMTESGKLVTDRPTINIVINREAVLRLLRDCRDLLRDPERHSLVVSVDIRERLNRAIAELQDEEES